MNHLWSLVYQDRITSISSHLNPFWKKGSETARWCLGLRGVLQYLGFCPGGGRWDREHGASSQRRLRWPGRPTGATSGARPVDAEGLRPNLKTCGLLVTWKKKTQKSMKRKAAKVVDQQFEANKNRLCSAMAIHLIVFEATWGTCVHGWIPAFTWSDAEVSRLGKMPLHTSCVGPQRFRQGLWQLFGSSYWYCGSWMIRWYDWTVPIVTAPHFLSVVLHSDPQSWFEPLHWSVILITTPIFRYCLSSLG